MEVGDKIQIGKYECNVSGTYGDYYLGVPEVDNNNIYDQFNISREDLFKNSAGLGSFTDYGKFPYHKSLSDLDKTIAYIKSYDTKHLIGSKNHPEYSNLKGRQVKFLKNLRKYNVGDFGTIISENDNYPDALLQLCDKHSVNRSRFRDGTMELVPVGQEKESNYVGRYVKFLKDRSNTLAGTIDQIIPYKNDDYLNLQNFGTINKNAIKEGFIEILPIDYSSKFEEWNKFHPNYVSLVGRYIKWTDIKKIGTPIKSIIDKIIKDEENSIIITEHYGRLDRGRFIDGEVILLPKDYKPIGLDEKKSVIGRYIKWLIHSPIRAGEKGKIDKILSEDSNYYHLEKYGSADKKRLTNGSWELLPEGYNPDSSIIKSTENPIKQFNIGDKIYGKSRYGSDITKNYNPNGVKGVYAIVSSIQYSMDNTCFTLSCGEGTWNCLSSDIHHYREANSKIFITGTGGANPISGYNDYSHNPYLLDEAGLWPSYALDRSLQDGLYIQYPLTPEECYSQRKKPSLLEPISIKKRKLI